MYGQEHFERRRSRIVIGLVVVAVSLGVSVSLAGLSFAQASSPSSAQYQYGKITICHHTHSKRHPTVTIVINQHAWNAHRRHGDTLGACSTAPAASGSESKGHGHKNGKVGRKSEKGNETARDRSSKPDHGRGRGK